MSRISKKKRKKLKVNKLRARAALSQPLESLALLAADKTVNEWIMMSEFKKLPYRMRAKSVLDVLE